MPRELILVTDPRSRLDGSTLIEPGYPRDYTPAEMRTWAEDLERLYRTPPEEVERWRSLPPEALAPEQQRALTAHDKYFVEPDRGIKGSLREDGTVELAGGRHRAGYLLERGTSPIPVWVTAPDQRQLDEFRQRCEVEPPRQRSTPERQPLERGTNTDERGDRVRT
jgi:hypothetical protein